MLVNPTDRWKMNFARSAMILVGALLLTGCVALGLGSVTTPSGIKVKLEGKHSPEEIEAEIAKWETFGVTVPEEEARHAYSPPEEYPRWPLRQEWLLLRSKMQPRDRLWYFYGVVHGWCIRRDGRYIEFLIIEESPERKRALQPPQTTSGSFAPLRV